MKMNASQKTPVLINANTVSVQMFTSCSLFLKESSNNVRKTYLDKLRN